MTKVTTPHTLAARRLLIGVSVAAAMGCSLAGAAPAIAVAADGSGSFSAELSSVLAATVDEGESLLTAADPTPDTSWYDADKTEFSISTLGQMNGLAQLVNTGVDSFEGKTVKLCSASGGAVSISAGSEFDVIGSADHPFEGTFDGCSSRLLSPVINFAGASNIGLFGYAGEHATIANLSIVGGTLAVSQEAGGAVIERVGSIAGTCLGTISGCSSTMGVAIESSVAAQVGVAGTMREIGGLVGYIGTSMEDCVYGGTLTVTSAEGVISNDVTGEYMRYIAGYIGGIAGRFGSDTTDDLDKAQSIERCTNNGTLEFHITGLSDKDRFGEQTYSVTRSVGGIVGYSSGDIDACTNNGTIMTGEGDVDSPVSGHGAGSTGGIVGTLRGTNLEEAACAEATVTTYDPGYYVWKNSEGTVEPRTISVTNCFNSGTVVGLAAVGGIAGGTGCWTEVVGCGNEGYIKGTRWNKPAPAGIVGSSYGSISVCYNAGTIQTTTGAGYYAAGIAGFLSTYNNAATADNLIYDLPEISSCYSRGNIVADQGYKSAALVGESNGVVHDNIYLKGITVGSAIDTSDGTDYNNKSMETAQLKGSEAVAFLNAPLETSDWGVYFTVGEDGDFPQLSWQESLSKTDIATAGATVTLKANAKYSATCDPVPEVSITLANGTKLYQDSDFRVVPQEGARALTSGSTPYQATIVGMGRYSGRIEAAVNYGIDKGDISTCNIQAAATTFNWEQQTPSWVKVVDAAGNVLDESEYTISYPTSDPTDTKADDDGKYHDYVNCHSATYKYDVTVTATDTSNYEGSTTQACFRINWACMMESDESISGTHEEGVKLGNIVFGDETWDFHTALKDTHYIKIKYTGSEIKPTFDSVTYLGKTLRDGTNAGNDLYVHPLNYDYKYVYGNPNPEQGKESDASDLVNVTGSDELGCMTVRYTAGGNFENYTNVFYEIVPASIEEDVAVGGVSAVDEGSAVGKLVLEGLGNYDGAVEMYVADAQAAQSAVLTYNGMTLKAGRDYAATYTALTGVEGFVDRLYNNVLGRAADEGGRAAQVAGMRASGAAQITFNFYNSDEFKERSAAMSNGDIVENVYQTMLGRASDEGGKAMWTEYLDNGMSACALAAGFAESGEFRALCGTYGVDAGSADWLRANLLEPRDKNPGVTAFASRMYTVVLSRAAEVDGLNVQCQALINGTPCYQIACNFFNSAEFAGHHYTSEQVVRIAYAALLGRDQAAIDKDTSGIAYWVKRLEANGLEDMVRGFCQSDEFEAICQSCGMTSGMR